MYNRPDSSVLTAYHSSNFRPISFPEVRYDGSFRPNSSVEPVSNARYNAIAEAEMNRHQHEKSSEQAIHDIEQYETILEEMATATLDQDFKDELSAIEQWFRVLSEAERTASIYAFMQQITEMQLRFFVSVMTHMLSPSNMSSAVTPANMQTQSKPASPAVRESHQSDTTGLDESTIRAMFPDAAAAIAEQKSRLASQHPANSRESVSAKSVQLRDDTFTLPIETPRSKRR